MKKIIHFLPWTALLLVLIYVGYTQRNHKIGWVELSKVYDGFDLRKDLENKFIAFGTTQKQVLDSLELDTRMAGRKAKVNKAYLEEFEYKKANYFEQKAKFEDQVREVRASYDKQVMLQLRSLSKKFGNKNHYVFINGLDESGILLYASDETNITNDLLAFVNEEYKGIH